MLSPKPKQLTYQNYPQSTTSCSLKLRGLHGALRPSGGACSINDKPDKPHQPLPISSMYHHLQQTLRRNYSKQYRRHKKRYVVVGRAPGALSCLRRPGRCWAAGSGGPSRLRPSTLITSTDWVSGRHFLKNQLNRPITSRKTTESICCQRQNLSFERKFQKLVSTLMTPHIVTR